MWLTSGSRRPGKISLGDDADQISAAINDRQPADSILKHQLGGLYDRRPATTAAAYQSGRLPFLSQINIGAPAEMNCNLIWIIRRTRRIRPIGRSSEAEGLIDVLRSDDGAPRRRPGLGTKSPARACAGGPVRGSTDRRCRLGAAAGFFCRGRGRLLRAHPV